MRYVKRSKAHEVNIWKRQAERAELAMQQLRTKVKQFDLIIRLLGQEWILLMQATPTQEHTANDTK